MGFDKGRIIITVFTINMLLMFTGFPLNNHDVIFSFFTEGENNDYSTYTSQNSLTFGSDTQRTGSNTTITAEIENLKSTGDPVGTTSFFSDVWSGVKLLGGFLFLFVTYALGGIVAFAINSGLPIYFYAFILPVQVMYILALVTLKSGRA